MKFSSWSIIPFLTTRCPSLHFFSRGWGGPPWGLGSPQVCQEHPGWSYLSADTINLEICQAVSSVSTELSILAFHKYYITSQNPVFHTGSLRVHPVEGVYPVKDSSILYQQVSPILVWLSTPDVLLGVFFSKAWGGLPWCLGWNPRPFWQWGLSCSCPLRKSLKSVQPFSRFTASKPFWPFINIIL